MNLPNLITLIRIFLVPLFLFAILTRLPFGQLIAAALFVVAAISDGVDGYIARKTKAITRLGKFLDPLADKLLVSAALIALVELGLITTWVAIIIISRELAVTGLRAIAAGEGTIISAGLWGKVKTVFQIIFIVTVILADSLPAGFWLRTLAHGLTTPLLLLTIGFTLWSGVDYFLAYTRGLNNPDQPRPPMRFRWKLPLRRRNPKPEGGR